MDGIEILDSGPGQINLAIIKMKNNLVLAREVEDSFGAIRGIHQVEADPVQGLLSIKYDQRELSSFFSLLKLKEAFSSLFPEINISQLATWVSRTL